MDTRGILLLLMKSLRLRVEDLVVVVVVVDSGAVLTPVGGKKFWIVGFFGLFILLAPADMVRPGLADRVPGSKCWIYLLSSVFSVGVVVVALTSD